MGKKILRQVAIGLLDYVHHSIATALINVSNDPLLAIDCRAYAIFVLLDFNSAFDTTDHDILLSNPSKRKGTGNQHIQTNTPYGHQNRGHHSNHEPWFRHYSPCQHYNKGQREEQEREIHKQHIMLVPLPIDGHKGWWINTKSAHRSNCTYTGAPKGLNRQKCDVIYEMPCLKFNKTYTGETGRTFGTHRKENQK